MAETVFILGAGASACAGAPMMNRFLDRAEDLARDASIPDFAQSWQSVHKAYEQLKAAQSKAQLRLDNIEDLFAALEMSEVLGCLGPLGQPDVQALSLAMRCVIVRTVEHTLKFPWDGNRMRPPEGYERFVEFVTSCGDGGQMPAVLTFNYDVALDFAFHFAGVPIDYALWEGTSPRTVPLLKLHGSTNWAWCGQCNLPVPWSMSDYFSAFSVGRAGALHQPKNILLTISEHMKGMLTHAGHAIAQFPMIVPPTWSKSTLHKSIRHVWERAARELAGARNIVIIGYSLPDSDYFFRYLYALGTLSATRIRTFCVIDPDGSVVERYKTLLGPEVLPRLQHYELRFEDCVSIIATILARSD